MVIPLYAEDMSLASMINPAQSYSPDWIDECNCSAL